MRTGAQSDDAWTVAKDEIPVEFNSAVVAQWKLIGEDRASPLRFQRRS